MVKSVSFEKYFEERCLSAVPFSHGIIIGGTIRDEECLFLPIASPKREDAPSSLQAIDKSWVFKHCKNLKRMLPGGLRISGLFLTSYASSSSEEVTTHSELLLELLREVCESDKCNLKDLIHNDHSEKLVLIINPEIKKLSCFSVDTEDSSDTLKHTEMRVRPVLNRWKAIKSSASLSVKVSLSSDRRKEKIQSRLEQAVVPYLRSFVNDTEMMVCNEMLTDSTPLFEHFADTKIAEREKKSSLILNNVLIDTCSTDFDGENYWSNLEFIFYGPHKILGMEYCGSSSESGASSDTGFQRKYCSELDKLRPIDGEEMKDRFSDNFEKSLFLEGIIPGIAFLPITATVGDAKSELRKDLVRSTLARLELITDELNICSGEIEVPKIYLPQRVLVRLPACRSLPLSDYKFSSETPDDVVSRLIHYSLPLGSQQSEQNAQDMIQFLSGKRRLTRSARDRNRTSQSDHDIYAHLNSHCSPASSTTSIDSGHETAECEIAIDTDCLNFGLESEPEFFLPRDPLMKNLDKNIEHAVKYRSSIALFIIGALSVLVLGLFIAYFKM